MKTEKASELKVKEKERNFLNFKTLTWKLQILMFRLSEKYAMFAFFHGGFYKNIVSDLKNGESGRILVFDVVVWDDCPSFQC